MQRGRAQITFMGFRCGVFRKFLLVKVRVILNCLYIVCSDSHHLILYLFAV